MSRKPFAAFAEAKKQEAPLHEEVQSEEVRQANEDATEIAQLNARKEAEREKDPILKVAVEKNLDVLAKFLEKPYVTNWIAPWFGQGYQIGNSWNRFQASRYYIMDKTVIDIFRTKRAEEAANVPLRRKLCIANGYKYAAIGPTQNVIELMPQLGL